MSSLTGKDEFTKVLGNQPSEIGLTQMDTIEEFIRLLYGASENSLGAERLHKFRKSTDDDLMKLPSSREALLQPATKQVIFDRNVKQI